MRENLVFFNKISWISVTKRIDYVCVCMCINKLLIHNELEIW